MLLLACDNNGAWQNAHLDWVEEKEDGAVEVIATRVDGTRLALEHTLIQPFVGEKFDSEVFMRAFGRIENPALTLAERQLDVIIPVNAIRKAITGMRSARIPRLASRKPDRRPAGGPGLLWCR